jgi:CelD/BcsL family acetyltransferase involved in cellulose biosynthesis
VDPVQLRPGDLAAWQALEAEAVEANPYQSPHFVLPALRHLDPGLPCRVLLVDAPDPGRLAAAAVLVPRRTSPRLRLPHVEVYLSRHSYLGAPLIAPGMADAAAAAMLKVVRTHWPAALALLLPRVDAEGAVVQAFDRVLSHHGRKAERLSSSFRAMLHPMQARPNALPGRLKLRVAKVRRCRRQLRDVGSLDWRVVDGADLAAAAETFLSLEHLGWKGKAGSSLRSRPADETFFLACIAGFATRGQAWFTELRLDRQAIASTCNFRSGGAGFAFKLGWDPAWRRYGPGFLNQAALVEAAPTCCAGLAYLDSGSEAGCYIEELWPSRRELVDLSLPVSAIGNLILCGMGLLRRFKRRLSRQASTGSNEASQDPNP